MWPLILSWDHLIKTGRTTVESVRHRIQCINACSINGWINFTSRQVLRDGYKVGKVLMGVIKERETVLTFPRMRYFLPPERLQGGYRAGPGRLHCRLHTGTVFLRPCVLIFKHAGGHQKGEAGPLHGWMPSRNSNRAKPPCFWFYPAHSKLASQQVRAWRALTKCVSLLQHRPWQRPQRLVHLQMSFQNQCYSPSSGPTLGRRKCQVTSFKVGRRLKSSLSS